MTMIKILSLVLTLTSTASFAKVIQILHTNDLHSYFQGTRGGIGGYAQLKNVLTELREKAQMQGIPTLHLDGGDFGEGSSFYFSNHGVDSLRALDLLGVDVTVLGNHDFILGGKELGRQIRKAKLKAHMLSANLKGKWIMGLSSHLPNHVDYEFEGMKLRIFGLTTSEIHFMYPLRPLGFISNPIRSGIKESKKAKKKGMDFTIALTHIGLEKDIELVRKTHDIDMVVGGHSHIRLSKPELTKNASGRLIPILQAGAHSGHVGSMILDIQPGGETQLIDYKMIDVMRDMPQDETVKKFVEKAYQNREEYFGRSWEEVIGFSEIPLNGSYNGQETRHRTCWSQHMARLTRKVAKTQLGLQFDVFQGERIDPGLITYGDMVDNFPHFRKWGDDGWRISKAWVSGFVLNEILKFMANSELGLQVVIDGIKTKGRGGRRSTPFDPRTDRVPDARINGESIKNMKFYSVALPTEVSFGMERLLEIVGHAVLIHKRVVPHSSYWPQLEKYIRENSPIRCLED